MHKHIQWVCLLRYTGPVSVLTFHLADLRFDASMLHNIEMRAIRNALTSERIVNVRSGVNNLSKLSRLVTTTRRFVYPSVERNSDAFDVLIKP